MLKILFPIFWLSWNSYSLAQIRSGYEVGNGGTYLHCSESSSLGKSYHSLDKVEGELIYGFESSPHIQTLSDEIEILNFILSKLEQVDPPRSLLYNKWLKEIVDRREFVNELPSSTEDSGLLIKIKGCEAKQAAVFIADHAQKNIRFIFDKTLYDLSSPLDRAYLLLHEIIYREARLPKNSHLHSIPARYLTAWLMKSAETLETSAWIESLQYIKFMDSTYQNIPLILTHRNLDNSRRLAPLKRYPSGKIHKAILNGSFKILINNQILDRSKCAEDNGAALVSSQYVEFYESGGIKHLVFDMSLHEECPSFQGKYNYLEFTESGVLIQAQEKLRLPNIYEFENE